MQSAENGSQFATNPSNIFDIMLTPTANKETSGQSNLAMAASISSFSLSPRGIQIPS